MIGQVLLEGLGLGVLLVLVCAVGIRKGVVGMVHLYHADVQERCVELGLTTHEAIRKNSLRFKCICMPGYIAYVLICVYAVNGARGFLPGVWRIDMIKCPYHDACVHYGCPELCPCFCDSDDITYNDLHPDLLWRRTRTLGRGNDCCDFCLKLR